MCFVLWSVYDQCPPVPKVATRDIPVYKVIQKNGWGSFYSIEINGKREPWKQGYHYIETTPFINPRRNPLSYHWFFDGDCFHSYIRRPLKSITSIGSGEMVVRMYIPKGAMYYKNDTQYISSEIVYPRK